MQGLTAPLLVAGARSVVATGWRISDRSTLRLVTGFYRELARGRPVTQALRATKLASFREGMPARDWAAFVTIGDPLVRVPLHEPSLLAAQPLLAGALILLIALGGLAARRWRRPRRGLPRPTT